MGDFNAANNPIKDRSNNATKLSKKPRESWKPEILLFPYLEDLDFTDIQNSWEETSIISKQFQHTWKNKNASSRIDYI